MSTYLALPLPLVLHSTASSNERANVSKHCGCNASPGSNDAEGTGRSTDVAIVGSLFGRQIAAASPFLTSSLSKLGN